MSAHGEIVSAGGGVSASHPSQAASAVLGLPNVSLVGAGGEAGVVGVVIVMGGAWPSAGTTLVAASSGSASWISAVSSAFTSAMPLRRTT